MASCKYLKLDKITWESTHMLCQIGKNYWRTWKQFTLDRWLCTAWTSYLKSIACNLFFPPPLPKGSILSTYSKPEARGLVPLSRSVFGIPLHGVQRKFASLRKLPELSGNTPFCWMQTRRNPQTWHYTPKITMGLLAFFYFFLYEL